MAEFHSSKSEEAARLNEQAGAVFEEGSQARHVSDGYVWLTVMLATVLLLAAISQRFKILFIRIGLVAIAMLLLLCPVFRIFELPRLK
jgi:hypothetical protein